jgi:D-3-phosphoglycerate dehydrogenase
MKNNCLIFDFDSTIVSIETFDHLIAKSIFSDNHQEQNARVEQIKKITDQAMSGKITFAESLQARFSSLKITKNELNSVNSEINNFITEGFIDLISEIKNDYEIFIVSGGFLEIISPVAEEIGIKKENCFANNFIFQNELIIGFDKDNILAKNGGKIEIVKKILQQKNYQKIFMIGDGSTDLEVSKAIREVNFCYAAFHTQRESVMKEVEKIDQNSANQIFKIFHQIADLKNFLKNYTKT